MPIRFSNDKPIFLQLAEIIKGDIIGGKLKNNEKLPSVREFALTYAVNPNTVQKALQILEEDGLIFTDRTNGKFVADSLMEIERQRKIVIKKEVDCFYEKMVTLGIDKAEIINLINKIGE